MTMPNLEELETNLKGFSQTIKKVAELNKAFEDGINEISNIHEELRETLKQVSTIETFHLQLSETLKTHQDSLQTKHHDLLNQFKHLLTSFEENKGQFEHHFNSYHESLKALESKQHEHLNHTREKIETHITRQENELLKAFREEAKTLNVTIDTANKHVTDQVENLDESTKLMIKKSTKVIIVMLVILSIINLTALAIQFF